MKSQNEALIKYLINHTHITSWIAMEKLGITSLPKRICELTKSGYHIDKKWAEGTNRYGNKIRVRKYYLVHLPRLK